MLLLTNAIIRSFFAACLFISLLMAPSAQAEILKIGGTGGDLGTMRAIGAAFQRSHHGYSITVLPSLGSGGGIKAVLDGKIDIALSSRPLKDKEKKAGARAFAYARTALVFAVRDSVPDTGLSLADILKIYQGKRVHWSDGAKIRLVLRPLDDGDTRLVQSGIPDLSPFLSRAITSANFPIAFDDQEMADLLESVPGALGFTSLSLIRGEGRPLKALSLNGVLPGADTLENGAYTLQKTFYFVTGPDPEGRTEAFFAFVLGAEGKAILRKTGHMPMGRDGG